MPPLLLLLVLLRPVPLLPMPLRPLLVHLLLQLLPSPPEIDTTHILTHIAFSLHD